MFAAPTPRRLVLIAAAALAGSFMAISPALPMFPAPSAAVQTALSEPAPARSRPVRVRSQAEAASTEAGSCSTTRLKLWIEDEGWVVRRIHRCW